MTSTQTNSAVLTDERQQTAQAVSERKPPLTDAAFDRIREAEKVSAFGRFALKLQSAFQRPDKSGASAGREWRLAPVVLSAVTFFAIALGLLFILSKPESSVSRRAQKAATLVGPEDNKRMATAVYVPAPVTENQLAGSDALVAARPLNAKGRNTDMILPRSSTLAPGPATGASRVVSRSSAGLQAPATVFTATVPTVTSLKAAKPVEPTAPDLRLPTGTEIAAHTTNAISSGLDSPVIAVVDRDVALDGVVLIPQGTQAIGQTAGAAKDRVNIRFTSLVLPDQREMAFSGLGLMRDGSAGLEGKVQGSTHPVLAGAGRVATGAAVLATEFAGRGSGGLDRPFSEGDMLRNQLSTEIASEGNGYSNRLQRPFNVPIIKVPANQSIRIFLLSPMHVTSKTGEIQPTDGVPSAATVTPQETAGTEDGLAAAQAEYIQSLEAQVAQLRAALESRQQASQH